jgi:FkbM family methyltransferase
MKTLERYLPGGFYIFLRVLRYRFQMWTGAFRSPEPEWKNLREWVKPGDSVLDIGANVGHYTRELSRIVGKKGTVTAFEPVPVTFGILGRLMGRRANVALHPVAASHENGRATMSVPGDNYYRAKLGDGGDIDVQTRAIDTMPEFAECRVDFVKIDAEGHEVEVLEGMKSLIHRCRPTLLIENNSKKIGAFLASYDYQKVQFPKSPNLIFVPKKP